MDKEHRISLSFKQHEKELYEFIKQHSSPSSYIKDIVKIEMKKEKQT